MARADVPSGIGRALAADTAAKAVFKGLPPSHRREYLNWVGEARSAEKPPRRIVGMLVRLNGSRTQSGNGEG
jgi:uncharacterized protein YdeI (YjbR/CyaY-like superfamily)